MTVKQLEGEVFAYNVKFADYIYGMITSHPGITWLVVNKQRIKIGFIWSSLLK